MNLNENNVPERLLNVFLENYQKEKDAAIINLSSSFLEDNGQTYSYDVSDKLKLENKPPTYIKMTKVPKFGNIVVKKNGELIVLNEGDYVETAVFKNFIYDQGRENCSSLKYEKCKDSFSYVTFSEWIGKGSQKRSTIDIDPVSK